MKQLIYLTLSCLLGACVSENCKESITFINNSNSVVYVQGSQKSLLTVNTSPIHNNLTDARAIANGGIKDLGINHGCWNEYFDGSYGEYSSDTLYVFVFDDFVAESTPWDSIVKYQSYLKRYSLSLNDLNASNWKITYP